MSKKQDLQDQGNSLKRQTHADPMELEPPELINSKKRSLLALESGPNIDYEASFKRHLLKEAELQKSIELFNKNIGDKILYDQNFSEMLMEMASYLETNNAESLENYHKLLHNNQEFLSSKAKESPENKPENEEGKLKAFLEAEKLELESKEAKLKESVKEHEKRLKEEQELLEFRQKEVEIYQEMTNLTVELKENKEENEVYECEVKNMADPQKFIRFQLKILPENEIQYVPVKIAIDVRENKELEEEMFFDGSQNEHFMALIYKIVNRDLFI